MNTSAIALERLVNSSNFNARRVAAYCAYRMHRYLQSVLIRFCHDFIIYMAENYKDGNYDDRNEDACRGAYVMAQAIDDDWNNGEQGQPTFYESHKDLFDEALREALRD